MSDEMYEARRKARDELMKLYRESMVRGTQYQRQATAMHNESEPAAAGYAEMKKDFRSRDNWRTAHGQNAQDYTFSQMKAAQDAGKDNQWYMLRATMFSNLATMEFGRATALMQNILRMDAILARMDATRQA